MAVDALGLRNLVLVFPLVAQLIIQLCDNRIPAFLAFFTHSPLNLVGVPACDAAYTGAVGLDVSMAFTAAARGILVGAGFELVRKILVKHA